jgi:hypothetical protein
LDQVILITRSWMATPAGFWAVSKTSHVPAAVVVPVILAVPFELAVQTRPLGSPPIFEIVAAGEPVVVIAKLMALDRLPARFAGLVKAGA